MGGAQSEGLGSALLHSGCVTLDASRAASPRGAASQGVATVHTVRQVVFLLGACGAQKARVCTGCVNDSVQQHVYRPTMYLKCNMYQALFHFGYFGVFDVFSVVLA